MDIVHHRKFRKTRELELDVDPDFAEEVVQDLYRYQHKKLSTARLWLFFTGIVGGHLFYLGHPLRGLAYFFTGGGVLVLWIRDFARVRALVDEYNLSEDQRQAKGMPPQALSFLPPKAELNLDEPPRWSARRDGRAVLFGGSALLALIGFVMGIITSAVGVWEPATIIIVLMLVTLTAARWPGMHRIPILRDLSRWNHRLRLYYFSTDPGSVWLLAARPVFGPLIAPWSKQARAEIKLYLQLGVAFALLFIIFDVREMQTSGFWVGFGLMVAEFGQTVVYTYVFIAPVGAILITQQLVARKDGVVGLMCVINLAFGYLGYWLVG